MFRSFSLVLVFFCALHVNAVSPILALVFFMATRALVVNVNNRRSGFKALPCPFVPLKPSETKKPHARDKENDTRLERDFGRSDF